MSIRRKMAAAGLVVLWAGGLGSEAVWAKHGFGFAPHRPQSTKPPGLMTRNPTRLEEAQYPTIGRGNQFKNW